MQIINDPTTLLKRARGLGIAGHVRSGGGDATRCCRRVPILENQPLREKLGANAREWAWQHLQSWDERLEQELREMEKLVSKRVPPRNRRKRSWLKCPGLSADRTETNE